MNSLLNSILPQALFHRPPEIDFKPSRSICECGIPLNIQYTYARKVRTLDLGEIIAKETVLFCEKGCGKNTYKSEELHALVPEGCNFSYDVLVYVGRSVYEHGLSEKNIIDKVKQEKNIKISPTALINLLKKFIIYLAIAHQESQTQIREAMTFRGGYIIQIDGTCEGNSPFLITIVDGITGIVLDSIKAPSESKDVIIPLLERVKEAYGNPLALMHDMGKGIICAVKEVFPGIIDLICHFHFLRDCGKDLFAHEHDLIRLRFKKYGIKTLLNKRSKSLEKKIDIKPELVDELTKSIENQSLPKSLLEDMPLVTAYTLIQWALDYENEGDGYGLPFDRPYLEFYRRLKVIYSMVNQLKEVKLKKNWKYNKPLYKLYNDLHKIINNKSLQKTVTLIEQKIEVFDKLRNAMRITISKSNKGLNDDGEQVDMKTIEQGVKDFSTWVCDHKVYSRNNDYIKMIEQIDKYSDKLFADPIEVNTPNGKFFIQPQRTNNLLERLFRYLKQIYRMKSGMCSLNKKMNAILADVPLIKNLKNKEYMDIILNGKDTLSERFAEIEAKTVRNKLKEEQDQIRKIPVKIKKIIRTSELPTILENLFKGALAN